MLLLGNSSKKVKKHEKPLKELNKYPELEAGINDVSLENDFPNASTLVLSALLVCLEDESPLVKRNILDFLYTHVKVSHPSFSDRERVVLVEAALWLLIRKDVSITRRVNILLLGKPDLENKYNLTEENAFVLPLIVEAFKSIFSVVPKSL